MGSHPTFVAHDTKGCYWETAPTLQSLLPAHCRL